jgi:capsular polysaccharide transport system permease protein
MRDPVSQVTMNHVDRPAPVIEQIELTPIRSEGELLVGTGEGAVAPLQRFHVRHALFVALVAIPLLVAGIYYFLIASDRYVSETRFIVRSSSSNLSNFAAAIENQGLSRANDETYAVNDYLVSRDIVDILVRSDGLKDVLARPEADFVNRYPNFYTRANRENLYVRYKEMIGAGIDQATGISVVKVTAFRPDDAQKIAAAVVAHGESLVNRLNERAYDDAEHYAQAIVDKERAHVFEIEAQLTAYRNASGTVDPAKEAGANFELIGKMATELSLMQAELQQQTAVAPANPGLPAMRERVRSYQAEIDRQKLAIVGNNSSLAAKLAGFERLVLERELAARSLGLATVNLAKAREEAQQQHLYLQTIVLPNLPDEADWTYRLYGMLKVLALSLGAYVIVRTLLSIASERGR